MDISDLLKKHGVSCWNGEDATPLVLRTLAEGCRQFLDMYTPVQPGPLRGFSPVLEKIGDCASALLEEQGESLCLRS